MFRRIAAALPAAALIAALAFSALPAHADTHGSPGGSAKSADKPAVHVFKSPWCGCCTAWVEIMRREGYAVRVTEREDLAPIKTMLGISPDLQSCHTATVGGYAIEGHVPPADIARLLETKPKAGGLAVPGMPVGSPGMEQDGRQDAYDVILFSRNGRSVYSRH